VFDSRAGTRNEFLLRNFHATNPTSYLIRTASSYPEVKKPRSETYHSPPSTADVKITGAINVPPPPSPSLSHLCIYVPGTCSCLARKLEQCHSPRRHHTTKGMPSKVSAFSYTLKFAEFSVRLKNLSKVLHPFSAVKLRALKEYSVNMKR